MRTYELDLMGLVVDCPFGEALWNCPLKSIRTLPLRERIRKVKKLSVPEMERIVAYHKTCVERREDEKALSKELLPTN